MTSKFSVIVLVLLELSSAELSVYFNNWLDSWSL